MATEILGNRYQIMENIDEGGMGTVFRAWDYLNEKLVAVKRVKTANAPVMARATITHQDGAGVVIQWASDATSETPQQTQHDTPRSAKQPDAPERPVVVLATHAGASEGDDRAVQYRRLAQEFRTLASLRHPNILSVLDYGFDRERSPYLVMELLENAVDIRAAADTLPLAGKIDLVLQLLQALVYLHRQRIIHCDLKPGNVLVTRSNQVKVLDFGLALRSDAGVLAAGTLAYVAPEILYGRSPAPTSDLYSLGTMMYEILVGQHPFDIDDFDRLIEDVLYKTPDMSTLERDYPALAPIVRHLTSKDPNERYGEATRVIQVLCEALDQAAPQEHDSIRESFLQAATFVGRQAELDTLADVLRNAQAGQGSAWLVGGETGVGKSRLLDEFRSLALVEGAIVIRGQNVQGSPIFYQMWRELLRPLVISARLSDLEAGVLKHLIPDLPRLLNRRIPDVPALVGEQDQQRLAMTIADVIQRQKHLIVLLMEDLHWAEESLTPVRILSQLAPSLPLVMIGTYRSDEYPYFYGTLPAMRHMHLRRLTPDEIATLSYSMLGQAGTNPALLNLLVNQSEGNTLFIVETLRSLAEEAGQLANIDLEQIALTNQRSANGIEAVIQRRLQHLPDQVQPFLRLAAVAGRTIDLKLFDYLYGEMDYLDWLAQGVDAAIFELADTQWRFAHDKIRESILKSLSADALIPLHHTVAMALENVYAGNLDYAASLADHWERAGDFAQAGYYFGIAARQANQACEYGKAMSFANRPLAWRKNLPDETVLAALLELAVAESATGEHDRAIADYQACVALARRCGQTVTEAVAHEGLGLVARRHGDYEDAKSHYLTSMAVYHEIGDRRSTASILNQLARLDFMQGHYDEIPTFAGEALAIFNELGDLSGAAATQSVLSLVPLVEGDLETARAHLQSSLDLRRKIGDRYGTMSVLIDLGRVLYMQRQDERARQVLEEALQISRQISDQWHTAHALNNLAQVAFNEGDAVAAHYYLLESLQIGVGLRTTPVIVGSLIGMAQLLMLQGEFAQSAELLGLLEANTLSSSGFIQLMVRPLISGLLETMPPDDFSAAIQRGSQLDLYDTAQAMLVE